MSLVFVVIPVVMAYPALLAAAAAVASASGFTLVEQSAKSISALADDNSRCEEIELESREEMSRILEAEGGFSLKKEDLTFTFSRSPNSGRICMMVAGGRNRPREELKNLGKDLMNSIIQRYAYDRLMQELKKEGFKVVREDREEDRTIRLKVRKW